MARSILWLQVVALVMVMTCVAQENIPSQGTNCPRLYNKVVFNQTLVPQHIEYVADMSDLTGFTLHYRINLFPESSVGPVFAYVSPDGKTYLQVTVIQVEEVHFLATQVNGIVISNVKSPYNLVGEWHHFLHSWDSETGAWNLFLDGEVLEQGLEPQTRGQVIKGGGIAYSGFDKAGLTAKKDKEKKYKGLNGAITLLALDSRSIQNPFHWLTKVSVATIANACLPDQRGDVIGWMHTPRRGHFGAMEMLSESVCLERN